MSDYGPYAVYGVSFTSDHPFAAPLPTSPEPPELDFHLKVTARPWVESPPGWTEVFRGTAAFDDGRPMFRILQQGPDLLVRYGEVADFTLAGDAVAAEVYGADYVPAAEIYFLGTVLSIWLERRGALVLHGAAVECGGRAAILLGEKGAGKTTLTCGMLRRGSGLIADDLSVVHAGSSPRIPAAYPRLRLWPDQAEALFGLRDLEPVLPGETKRWAPLPSPDRFTPSGALLAGFYVLDRSNGPVTTRFTPMRGGEAVLCLVRHSFVPNVAQSLGLGPKRLARMTELASRTPVVTFTYGGSLDDLDGVCDALAEHVLETRATASTTPTGP